MANKTPAQAVADFFNETVADFDGEVADQGDFTIRRAVEVVRPERPGGQKG